MINIEKRSSTLDTYRLLNELSKINGSNVDGALLDRTMFNSEKLPPLGKEYWWLLFFDEKGENPLQMMLLIFRKYGGRILFNDKEMRLRDRGNNEFQAVTAGWVFDGERLRDLGDTNAVVRIERNEIIAEISSLKMTLVGGYPDYELRVGDIINLDIKKSNFLEDREARGVFIPPFGMGWVNIFSDADGNILGKNFKGTAHLQKVVGVTMFGPFNWGRIIFQNGSSTSFFCLKPGKDSKRYIHRSLTFYEAKNNEIVRFDDPMLKISEEGTRWVVEGKDRDKDFRIALDVYARKQFTLKGGGSQVYVEYAVKTKDLYLRTKDRVITIVDVGRGVGTFEDAYW